MRYNRHSLTRGIMIILAVLTMAVCCYGVPLTTNRPYSTLQVTPLNQQRFPSPKLPNSEVETRSFMQTEERRKHELAMMRRILLMRSRNKDTLQRDVKLFRRNKKRRNNWSIENAVKGKLSRKTLDALYKRRKKNMKLNSRQPTNIQIRKRSDRNMKKATHHILNRLSTKVALRKRLNPITNHPTENTLFLGQNNHTKSYHSGISTVPVLDDKMTMSPLVKQYGVMKSHKYHFHRDTVRHNITNLHAYGHNYDNTPFSSNSKTQSNRHDVFINDTRMRLKPTNSDTNFTQSESNIRMNNSKSNIIMNDSKRVGITTIINSNATLSKHANTQDIHFNNTNATEHTRMPATGVFRKGPDEYHLYLRGIHIVFADKFLFKENTDLPTLHMTANVLETSKTVEDKSKIKSTKIETKVSKDTTKKVNNPIDTVIKYEGMPVKFGNNGKSKLVGTAIAKNGNLYLMVHLPVNHSVSTGNNTVNIRKAIYQSLVAETTSFGHENVTFSPNPLSEGTNPQTIQNSSGSYVSTTTPFVSVNPVAQMSDNGSATKRLRPKARALSHTSHGHIKRTMDSGMDVRHHINNIEGSSNAKPQTSLHVMQEKQVSDSLQDEPITGVIDIQRNFTEMQVNLTNLLRQYHTRGVTHHHNGSENGTNKNSHEHHNNRTVIRTLKRQLEVTIDRMKSPWAEFNLSAVFPAPIATLLRHIDDDDDVYKIYSFVAKATDPFEKIRKFLIDLTYNNIRSRTPSTNDVENRLPSSNINANTSFNFELEIENIDVLMSGKDTNKHSSLHNKGKRVESNHGSMVNDGIDIQAIDYPTEWKHDGKFMHVKQDDHYSKHRRINNTIPVTTGLPVLTIGNHRNASTIGNYKTSFGRTGNIYSFTNAHRHGLGNDSATQYDNVNRKVQVKNASKMNISRITAFSGDSVYETSTNENKINFSDDITTIQNSIVSRAHEDTNINLFVQHGPSILQPASVTRIRSSPTDTQASYKTTTEQFGYTSHEYSTTTSISGINTPRRHSDYMSMPGGKKQHLQHVGYSSFNEQDRPLVNKQEYSITTQTPQPALDTRIKPETISQKQPDVARNVKPTNSTPEHVTSSITIPPISQKNLSDTETIVSHERDSYTMNAEKSVEYISETPRQYIATDTSPTFAFRHGDTSGPSIVRTATDNTRNGMNVDHVTPVTPNTTKSVVRHQYSDKSNKLQDLQMTILAAYEQYQYYPRSWVVYSQQTSTLGLKNSMKLQNGVTVAYGAMDPQTTQFPVTPGSKAITSQKQQSTVTAASMALTSHTFQSLVPSDSEYADVNKPQSSVKLASAAMYLHKPHVSLTSGSQAIRPHKRQSSTVTGLESSDSDKHVIVTPGPAVMGTYTLQYTDTLGTSTIDSHATKFIVRPGSGDIRSDKQKGTKYSHTPRYSDMPDSVNVDPHTRHFVLSESPNLKTPFVAGSRAIDSHKRQATVSPRSGAVHLGKLQSSVSQESWRIDSNKPHSSVMSHSEGEGVDPHKLHFTLTPDSQIIDSHILQSQVMPDAQTIDSYRQRSTVTRASGAMYLDKPQSTVTPYSRRKDSHKPQLSIMPDSAVIDSHKPQLMITARGGTVDPHKLQSAVTPLNTVIHSHKSQHIVSPTSATAHTQKQLSSVMSGSKAVETKTQQSPSMPLVIDSDKPQSAVTSVSNVIDSRKSQSSVTTDFEAIGSHKPRLPVRSDSGVSMEITTQKSTATQKEMADTVHNSMKVLVKSQRTHPLHNIEQTYVRPVTRFNKLAELTQRLPHSPMNDLPNTSIIMKQVQAPTTAIPYSIKQHRIGRKYTLNIVPEETRVTSRPFIPHARPIFWARIMDDDVLYPIQETMATPAPPALTTPSSDTSWLDDADGFNALLILSVDDLLFDHSSLHGALIVPNDYDQSSY